MLAPPSEYAIYFVVDTNILLHHFEVLAQFVEDVERLSLPVIVIVPGAVIYELDGQKNRDGLAWFARRASAWLLKKVKERKSIRGQANEETCKSTRNWKIREPGEVGSLIPEMFNDNLILDCCMYFSRGRQTLLCSADNNLCISSHAQDIRTISPSRHWSSKEISYQIYGGRVDLSQFGPYTASYRNPPDASSVDDDGRMDIDDDDGLMTAEVLEPSHALDLLHLQVIDHFTRLLVELVGRVGDEAVHRPTTVEDEANLSRHAPRWRHYKDWSAAECLEYLNRRRPVRARNPRAEVFLCRPYSRGGARRGQDWARKDWEVALGSLKETSIGWKDVSLQESLTVLEPHLQMIFGMRLRPTGV
ncbi:PIN domain-containing protein [Crassisporium funariophilum]|nr:PIN domain-containing protein [Crassisporium funariophilum]